MQGGVSRMKGFAIGWAIGTAILLIVLRLFGQPGEITINILIGIVTVIALALIGMASIAITLAVITMEEWDE